MTPQNASADRAAVRDCVYRAIDEINAEDDAKYQIEKSEQTRLFGAESRLDSLGLVSLIVGVEEQLDDEYGVALTLADEKAMSRQNSPFLTIATLIDYVQELLTEVQELPTEQPCEH